MIWIVTKSIIHSEKELVKRHEYITKVADCEVTPWVENKSIIKIPMYSCVSKKGEYGIFISAHMISEVPYILESLVQKKRIVVVINSCCIDEEIIKKCISIVKEKNQQSIVYWSKQEVKDGLMVSFVDDVGTFGFSTTISERELYQNRYLGLFAGIKKSFERRDIGL